jgi:mono/diheme cytochrome c family protein
LSTSRATLVLLLAAAAAAGCRQDMHNQPKYLPLRESKFFADGMSARQFPEGTVARGHLDTDPFFFQGKQGDALASSLPPSLPINGRLLARGHERFDIYCSPCHGRLGDGNGLVAKRGFKQPPSFHQDRLRDQPVGYFFDVMTHGFGVMPSYASQVPPEDRWAIAAYVRVLQMSQRAHLTDLEPVDQQALAASANATTGAAPAPANETASPE